MVVHVNKEVLTTGLLVHSTVASFCRLLIRKLKKIVELQTNFYIGIVLNYHIYLVNDLKLSFSTIRIEIISNLKRICYDIKLPFVRLDLI